MFYPNISRRPAYSKKTDGSYYASYEHYRDEVTEDCGKRCVYCDITLTEHGGEGMQLDHFKPQEHFKDLHNDPTNLVLACPKCNRLKSDYWPVDEDMGIDGFLDPFIKNRNEWYQVKSCGTLEHRNNATALKIELLNLNRPARVQIRRRRLIEERINRINERLNEKLNDLQLVVADDEVDNSRKGELLAEALSLKKNIDTLRTL